MLKLLTRVDNFLLRKFQACADFIELRFNYDVVSLSTLLFNCIAIFYIASLAYEIVLQHQNMMRIVANGLIIIYILLLVFRMIHQRKKDVIKDIQERYKKDRRIVIVVIPFFLCSAVSDLVTGFESQKNILLKTCITLGDLAPLFFFAVVFLVSCFTLNEKEN